MSVAIFLCSLLSVSSQAGFFDTGNDNQNPFFETNKAEQIKPVKIPEGASVLKDLSYGKNNFQQKLDIYLPKKEMLQKNAPIIFMVHGGAWMVGDKSYFPVVANKIDRWLKKGIIFVSINYRMSFSPNPLDQVEDIDSALTYVVQNAKKYGGDPAKIVIMGHSAGAHLVSLLTSNEKFSKQNWLGTISLDSAAFDLVETMKVKHYRFYDRVFGADKKTWIANSPAQQISKKVLPMLIICSQKRSDSCPQAEAFAKKAKAHGSDILVLPVDLTHKDVNETLGLPGKYTDNVEAFMKKVGITGL